MMRKISRINFVAVILFMVYHAQAADKVVTSKYVVNPSFEQGTTGWTITNMSPQTNSSFTKKVGTTYLEKWTDKGSAAGSASVTQVIEHLAAGKYRLNVVAQNIQQGLSDTQTGATIYADKVTNSTVVTSAQYYNVEFTTPGTKVTIGFRAVNATGNWLCVDNFRLYYVGPDFELLQTAITNAEAVITKAEKTTNAGIQPLTKANLLHAIEAAKAITMDSEETEMSEAAEDLADYQAKAEENANALKALKTALTKAKNYLSRNMAEMYLTTLQTAINEAEELLKLEDDRDITPVMTQLEKASEQALESYQAKRNLMEAINSISGLSTKGKEGSEELTRAISDAETVCNSSTATPQEMNDAQLALENAILYFRIQNGTGPDPIATTGTVIQGATEIYARGSFTGTALEKGFCYSENPEPTIFDGRTTSSYSNNGDIYVISNVKPATIYYVRAYIITTDYKLAYGDVVKTATRPLGNVTYGYDNAGSNEENKRIIAACDEAIWMWNNVAGVRDFYLDAHYVPGAGANGVTADCTYGGYMRISQNAAYQKTGTILHEGSHGLGVIGWSDYSNTHCNWHSDIYREDYKSGIWLGPRVDRVVQFLENNATAHLNGDYQHMWPYGINGANEDTGKPMLYRGNALVIAALFEDGLRQENVDFARPGYTFVQDDNRKYYIKNEDINRGDLLFASDIGNYSPI